MASSSVYKQSTEISQKKDQVHPQRNSMILVTASHEEHEATSRSSKKRSSCPDAETSHHSHTGHRRSSTSGSYTLLLEEAKSHPIFWNGTNPVSKLVWKLSPADLKFTLMTITEVLAKFTSQDYLRFCTVSVTTDNRLFSSLRMSDSFSTLFRGAGKSSKDKTIQLVLDEQFKPDPSRELSFKYILILSEANKQRVFWDGRKMVSNMVARMDEPHMLMTLETILKKYIGGDYLKNNGRLEQIVDKRKDSVKQLKLDDLLGSIFQGTSASIRLSNIAHAELSENNNNNDTIMQEGEKSEGELEAFRQRSLESFWLSGNWNEIREKVQYILEALDIVQRQRELPSYFEQKLTEERRNLETSVRRRNRSIDEVWRQYEALKTSVETASHSFKYKSDFESGRKSEPSVDSPSKTQLISSNPVAVPVGDVPPPSQSWHLLGSHRRESTNALEAVTSCFDGLATSLRGHGVEMYDEDSRISPMAGMAFTVVIVVVICIMSRCLA